MDPATLYTILTLHDGTIKTVREPLESFESCQRRAQYGAALLGVLAWCRFDRSKYVIIAH